MQLTGGLFNDALYEGEDGCEQDRQCTTCNVNNVARSQFCSQRTYHSSHFAWI